MRLHIQIKSKQEEIEEQIQYQKPKPSQEVHARILKLLHCITLATFRLEY